MATDYLIQNSEKLRYFQAVAQSGSIQRAGRALSISASTVSIMVKSLEEGLGVELFERSRTGMTLTEHGEKLSCFLTKYFKGLHEISDVLSGIKKASQRIVIGTYPTIAIYLWPSIVHQVESLENSSVTIKTGSSHDILNSLEEGDVDICLTVGKTKSKSVISRFLWSDEFVFVANKNGMPASYGTTKQQRLLYLPSAHCRKGVTLNDFVKKFKLDFKEVYELDSFEVVVELVKKNIGIGILPSRLLKVHSDLRKVKVSGTPGAFGTHDFYFSYRSNLSLPQRLVDSVFQNIIEGSPI